MEIVKHEVALTSENALDILKDYDYVVDGTDNFPTRYLVNDACVLLGKPNVYGSIFRFEGQATVFAYEGGPCYRCLYPEPPPPGLVPSCAEGGVLGILPGTIGLIQATETVKLILGIGEPLVGRLLLYDALGMRFRELKLRKNPECPICGDHRTITKLIDYHQFCGVPQPATQEAPKQETKVNEGEIEVTEVKEKLDRGDNFVLIDVREPHEYQICNIPGGETDSAGRGRPAAGRTRSGGRHRDPLQERHAQREGLRHSEGGRLQARAQHEGRDSGVERSGGSEAFLGIDFAFETGAAKSACPLDAALSEPRDFREVEVAHLHRRCHHIENLFASLARTLVDSASTFESISISPTLNRKLRTPEETLPCSTRNVPSRVIPVKIFS